MESSSDETYNSQSREVKTSLLDDALPSKKVVSILPLECKATLDCASALRSGHIYVLGTCLVFWSISFSNTLRHIVFNFCDLVLSRATYFRSASSVD